VLTERIDLSWKVSREKAAQWTESGFDDRAWPAARELVPFGDGIWGMLGGRITVSPVQADPFLGRCELSASDLTSTRIYLELDRISPETAARVTVNGKDAGGFIGRPSRLEIGSHLHPGVNTFHIEPFAPQSVRLAIYH